MSFLARATTAPTTRSTGRILQKRFGSHASHHGPEAPPTHEAFTTPGFRYTLIAVIGLLAWSRVDEHLTNQGEEKHPLTRYIEYYMRSEKESARINEQHIVLAQQAADDAKFKAGATVPPKVQLRYPDLMNTASAKLIPIASPDVSTDSILPKYH